MSGGSLAYPSVHLNEAQQIFDINYPVEITVMDAGAEIRHQFLQVVRVNQSITGQITR